MQNNKKIRIGKLSKQSGISVSALDYYVNQKLLNIAGHYGVFRLFNLDKCLKRLEKIKKLQRRGCSIKKIKKILG